MRTRTYRVIALVGLSLCLATLRAADDPAPKPPEVKPQISEVQIRTLAPVTYGYVASETTFDKLGEAIGAALPDLTKAAEAGKIKPQGGFILLYPEGSAHMTPDKPFKVHMGFLLAEGAEEGNVKVRKTEPFKAATVLYVGPVTHIGDCYQKLFPAIEKMGLKPTGEEREFTIYWEGMDSPNNVVMVQVGVK